MHATRLVTGLLAVALMAQDLTGASAPVAPGTVGAVACGPGDGWAANLTKTTYRYANESGALPGAGCAPGSAQGLKSMRLKDRREAHSEIAFTARASGATIAAPVGPLRGTIVLAADAAAGAAGACGVHEFGAMSCQLNPTGTMLRCR